jgi:hypothetical protein
MFKIDIYKYETYSKVYTSSPIITKRNFKQCDGQQLT